MARNTHRTDTSSPKHLHVFEIQTIEQDQITLKDESGLGVVVDPRLIASPHVGDKYALTLEPETVAKQRISDNAKELLHTLLEDSHE